MAWTSAFTTADIDAFAAALSDGVTGEYVQLESTAFRGRWLAARGRAFVVQFARQNIAVARRIRVPADRWAFQIPLHVPATARWDGRAVRIDEIIVCPPGAESLAFDPAHTRFALLSTPVGSRLAALARARVAAGADEPVALPCVKAGHTLRRRLEDLAGRVDANRTVALAAVRASLEAAIALSAAQRGVPDVGMPVRKRRIVHRAEAFERGHVSEVVSVAELSRVAGVSERSLRNAFYDVYSTSPKRYIQLCRLHRVRRALRATHGDGTTVTEVATDHGFFELGRFAGAYKSLFGEAPSETLSQARKDADAGARTF